MKIFFTLLLFGLLVPPSSAENTVVTAVCDPWPVLLDPDSEKQGLIVEIAQAAYLSQGYDLKVNFVPWSRAMVMIEQKRAHLLLGAWYTEERNDYLLYSKPIFSSAIQFIKPKDSTFSYEGINSLQGKRVGTILSYQYDQAFLEEKSIERIAANSLLYNIHNLIAGRIDLTLDDHYVLEYMLERHIPNWQDKVSFVEQPLADKDIFLAANRTNPEHKAIIEAFNMGLAQLKTSGRYKEIVSSYNLDD